MFVLDTNVVSEMLKRAPDGNVASWVRRTPKARIHVSAISKAELLFGLAIMPDGERKLGLANTMQSFFERELETAILPFGEREAELYAIIASQLRKTGRTTGQSDAQIASIARSNGFTVVTRNVRHFEDCGVEIINPWEAE